MQFLIAITLPFVVSVALAVVCSMLWWKSFQSPWQFFTLALLLLLGLHRVIQVVAEAFKLFRTELGGYFLEAQKAPDFYEIIQRQITTEAFAIACLTVVAGIPMLLWLRGALPKV